MRTGRHPFITELTCLFKTMIYAPKLSLPILVFPSLGLPIGVSVVWTVVAFSIAGTRAGRGGVQPYVAFLAGLLGGFVGYTVLFTIAYPPANLWFGGAHGVIAALANWAAAERRVARFTGQTVLRRVEKKMCPACSAVVTPRARRCWSCRTPLARFI